jgi:hypothetical protein
MNPEDSGKIPARQGPPPSHGRALQIRRPSLLARRGTALARVQGEGLPAHGRLPLAPNPLRVACWAALPSSAKERMESLAGQQVEWWAGMTGTSQRPAAVLIGRDGAVFADPRVDTAHQHIYVISCYVLAPASLVRADVVFRPARPAPARGTGEQPEPEIFRGGPGHPFAVPGVEPVDLAVIETLPPKAARLLTAPFTSAEPVLRAERHYEGTTERLDMFGIVLAGRRHITLTAGSRVVPHGHTERTAHWALTCVRADVVRRIGS